MKPSLTPLQHKLTTRSIRAPVKKLVRRVSSSDFYASNQIAVTVRRRTFTLSQVLEAAYAPSTNRLRQMVATKYQRFCMARKLPPKQESSAVQWLASTGTAPSTQITYMGHLKAIIAPLTPLQQYKRGLYRLGATSEPTQAHPFSRHLHMASLLSKLPSQTDRVAAWLTWKTASRWDETSRLRGPAILVVSPMEIILSWGAHTDRHASFSAQLQGGRTVDTSRTQGPSRASLPSGKTHSTQQRSVLNHDAQVQCKSGSISTDVKNGRGHKATVSRPPVFGEFYRESKQAQTTLPLHVPEVGTLDRSLLSTWAEKSPFAARWVELKRYLEPEYYANLEPVSTPQRSSTVSQEDIQAMLRSNIFEKCARPESGRPTSVVFAVDETDKNRRRSILWPPFLNEHLPRFPERSLVRDVVDQFAVAPNSKAIVYDLRAGFYQFELPEPIRSFYAFKVGKRYYRPCRLPMGVFFAPELVHTAMLIIAHEATAGIKGVQVNIHIDNIRFHGEQHHLIDAVASAFKERCHQLSATLKVEDPLVFLGAENDYNKGTCKVSERSLTKLLNLVPSILATPSLATLREFFSRLVWCSRILRIPLADYYQVIKFARRKYSAATRFRWSDAITVPIWPSILPNLQAWVARIRDNVPVTHPKEHQGEAQYTLFTDASLRGWGGVLLNNFGIVKTVGGRWEENYVPGDISELEMKAVENCASHWSKELSASASLNLLVDNTSVCATLRKGSAHSYSLNDALRKALRRLPASSSIKIAYIESALNPADTLSRNVQFSPATASAAKDAVIKRAEQSAGGPRGRCGLARIRVAGCTPTLSNNTQTPS